LKVSETIKLPVSFADTRTLNIPVKSGMPLKVSVSGLKLSQDGKRRGCPRFCVNGG
jgi:hypothetical protein